MGEPAKEKKTKRPVAVTIVGALLVVQAVFLLIMGALAVWASGALESLSSMPRVNAVGDALSLLGVSVSPGNVTLLLGAGFLLRGIVLLVIVAAFLRLRPWSWVLLMAWAGFNLATELIRFVYGVHDYVSMILLVVSVFLLNQAEVQEAFKLRKGADGTG